MTIIDERTMVLMLEDAGIDWQRPIPVTVPDLGSGLGCRLCIALHGLHGLDVIGLAQDDDEFAAHMRDVHEVG